MKVGRIGATVGIALACALNAGTARAAVTGDFVQSFCKAPHDTCYGFLIGMLESKQYCLPARYPDYQRDKRVLLEAMRMDVLAQVNRACSKGVGECGVIEVDGNYDMMGAIMNRLYSCQLPNRRGSSPVW